MTGRGWANAMLPRSRVGKRSMVWGARGATRPIVRPCSCSTRRAGIGECSQAGCETALGLRCTRLRATSGARPTSATISATISSPTSLRVCVAALSTAGLGTIWAQTKIRDIGANLKDKITVPDVLIQAHSASMGMIFYDGDQFPSEYSGDVFAAEHGSWNRSKRTGYKVIRVRLKDGVPTGEYEDFMTGFVVNDSSVWARPVGVAVAHDGALLVSEDGNGTIWRVSYRGGP